MAYQVNQGMVRQADNPDMLPQADNPGMVRQAVNPAMERQLGNPAMERQADSLKEASWKSVMGHTLPWVQEVASHLKYNNGSAQWTKISLDSYRHKS